MVASAETESDRSIVVGDMSGAVSGSIASIDFESIDAKTELSTNDDWARVQLFATDIDAGVFMLSVSLQPWRRLVHNWHPGSMGNIQL